MSYALDNRTCKQVDLRRTVTVRCTTTCSSHGCNIALLLLIEVALVCEPLVPSNRIWNSYSKSSKWMVVKLKIWNLKTVVERLSTQTSLRYVWVLKYSLETERRQGVCYEDSFLSLLILHACSTIANRCSLVESRHTHVSSIVCNGCSSPPYLCQTADGRRILSTKVLQQLRNSMLPSDMFGWILNTLTYLGNQQGCAGGSSHCAETRVKQTPKVITTIINGSMWFKYAPRCAECDNK